MTSSNRVACYVRISTHSQNEASQRAAIQRWLDGHGITDARWYVDTGSRDNLDRPDFKRMQDDIFMGEVGTVLVFKLDRISGSLRDGIVTLHDWLEIGIRLVSVTQGHDFRGTTGKLIAGVLFSVSEMEQETRRERQAEGIKEGKKRGAYKGRKPGSTKARPARARQLAAKGLTHREIAEAMGISRRTVIRYTAVV